MISIVIPVHYRNARLLVDSGPLSDDNSTTFVGALPALIYQSREAPVEEIIVIAEGGTEDDWEELRRYVSGSGKNISIRRVMEVSTFEAAASVGMSEAEQRFIVVMAPWIVLEDPQWFGKLQTIFLKTPHAGFVSIVESQTACAPPNPIDNVKADLDTSFCIATKDVVDCCLPTSHPSAVTEMQNAATSMGFRRWEHLGVRHFVCSHAEHKKIKLPT